MVVLELLVLLVVLVVYNILDVLVDDVFTYVSNIDKQLSPSVSVISVQGSTNPVAISHKRLVITTAS